MRRLDRFNGLAANIRADREFFERCLGFRLAEQIVLDDGNEAGMWLTATNKSCGFAYTREAHGTPPLPKGLGDGETDAAEQDDLAEKGIAS